MSNVQLQNTLYRLSEYLAADRYGVSTEKIASDMEKTITRGKKGWKGFLCDTGSIHNRQQGELMYDMDTPTNKCTVMFSDEKFENTFMRLMKDRYTEGTNFKQGDRVLICEPGVVDHDSYGELLTDAKFNAHTAVRLSNGKTYTGYTRNFIKQ
jgi:hypothetical protein